MSASAALVTSRAALAGTDFIDWGQLGLSFTTVNVSTPVTTNLLLPATLDSFATTVQRRDQGAGSWEGNFAPGDKLIWTIDDPGPISIAFTTGLSAIGTQIQANNSGAFDGTVAVFDSLNNLLEKHDVAGDSTFVGDNSAIFIGITRAGGDIFRVEFNIAKVNRVDFAINQVDLVAGGGGTVPEPASMALVALALAAAGAARRRVRQ